MRFHQFQGSVGLSPFRWIDLDAITAVEPRDRFTVKIWTGCASWDVFGSVDGVLALLQPAAAPDTYEEDLTSIKRARLDELKRIEEAIIERLGSMPLKLGTILDWRREAISMGKA